jgi:Fe-S cluster biosynthesis and repair protein YggX
MIKRRNWNVTDEHHCVLCPSHIYEDRIHLFFDCVFSMKVWNYLQIDWSVGVTIEDKFIHARKEFGKPFFTEVVILGAWHIWKQRNGMIFQHTRPSFRSWKRDFIHEASMHKYRVKEKNVTQLQAWIDSFP